MDSYPSETSPTTSASDKPLVSTQTAIWMHRWTDELISMRVTRPNGLIFSAGQYVRLGFRGEDGAPVLRPLSIASAPHDDFLEFYFNAARGQFSQILGSAKIGTEILIEHSGKGGLSLDRFEPPLQGQDLWLLGTGTGLAPFMSILRDATAFWRFENIALVISNREVDSLGYADELTRLSFVNTLDGRNHFHLIKTFTGKPSAGSQFGRINALLASSDLERIAGLPILPSRSRFILSGNPNMVASVSGFLVSRGFRVHSSHEIGEIAMENYW